MAAKAKIVTLSSTAKVDIFGDKDDDTLTIGADLNSSGATLRGGDGDDVVNASASDNAHTAKFVLKGDAGDDTISALVQMTPSMVVLVMMSLLLSQQALPLVSNQSGDLGDDDITLDTNEASVVTGGDGDDTIDIDTAATDNKGGHSITGGDGVDVFESITSTDTVEVSATSTPGDTTRLLYSSQSEFLTQGDSSTRAQSSMTMWPWRLLLKS